MNMPFGKISFGRNFYYYAAGFALLACVTNAGIMRGTIHDSESREPIPFASVRIEGTGQSILANANGEYRLSLADGKYKLKFSHVAYYSQVSSISLNVPTLIKDIFLRPTVIHLEGAKVYSRAYDPAQEIVIEAIRRKEEILSKIHYYSFHAFTKLVARDTTKAQPKDVAVITETQLEAFWEQPDKYKEIILARRQTSNLKPDENLVTIGEILNFNKNRLDLGRYSVVSPTAKDALEHYNYYLLDTVIIDNRAVFRLEIEPKNNYEPLFHGTIDIADSSFAVVGVDVGFSKGFASQFFKNPHYIQRFDLFEDEYWMPVEIRFTTDIKLGIPGVPAYQIDYVAALYRYQFETAPPKGTFDEYILEVAEGADVFDSTEWYALQLIPLTTEEQAGYHRIDSVSNMPQPLTKLILGNSLKLALLASTRYDFFHFNRVEGPYLGWSFPQLQIGERTELFLKSGYSFDGDYWQHRYGFKYRLSNHPRLRLSGNYHDEIVSRPTLMSNRQANPTLKAIANKSDPFDYLLEKGFSTTVELQPLRKLSFGLTYRDVNHYLVRNNTEYSLFRETKAQRLNPLISNGKLRSTRFTVGFDSRSLIKIKKREQKVFSFPFTIIGGGIEIASPNLFTNDFDYRRYSFWFYRTQRSLDLGITSIYLCLGASDKQLPPQKYFLMGFNSEPFEPEISFHTLGESLFNGDRAAAIYLHHDFGLRLFRKLHLPLLQDSPFSLSMHGGIFWTDFSNTDTGFVSGLYPTAPRPYSEFGFGIGRLPPLQLIVRFTWQLSDYDTNGFAISVGTRFLR